MILLLILLYLSKPENKRVTEDTAILNHVPSREQEIDDVTRHVEFHGRYRDDEAIDHVRDSTEAIISNDHAQEVWRDASRKSFTSVPSPCGRFIADVVLSAAREEKRTLWIVDLSSKERKKVLEGKALFQPAWNQGGTQIAIADIVPDRDGWGVSDLWIVDIAGAPHVRRILKRTDGFFVTSISWSPSGNLLAFDAQVYERKNGQVKASPRNIWVMPSAGGTPKRITDISTFERAMWPTFAADGKTVFFSLWDSREYARARYSLWKAGIKGSTPQCVFQVRDVRHPVASPKRNDLLAFSSWEGANAEVFILSLTKGKAIRATDGGGDCPVWSSDGTGLYFYYDRRVTKTQPRLLQVFQIAVPKLFERNPD